MDDRLMCGVWALDAAPHALALRASELAGVAPPDEASTSGFDAGDVVEVHGVSGSGKTLLLRCVLHALCAQPRAHVSTVVVIDADGRWPVEEDAAVHRAQRRAHEPGPDVHVVRCPGGTLDVVAALWHVRAVHTAGAAPQGRCVVLLDAANTFFWEDRCDGDAGNARLQALDTALEQLAGDTAARCTVFLARHDLFAQSADARRFVTYSFHLDRDQGVLTVGSDISTPFTVENDLVPLLASLEESSSSVDVPVDVPSTTTTAAAATTTTTTETTSD